MESLLADELRGLGAADVVETRAGVRFSGDLRSAYAACLWSRLANRVLLPVAHFAAPSPEELYERVREIDWAGHVKADGTLAVDFSSSGSVITHTRYGAQKTKDAIVDGFREATGVRPSVDLEHPDVRVNVYLRKDEATVSIDLSGASLHRRGYREPGLQVAAPLKENLAAAVLIRAGWPAVAAQGGSLVDVMCGSGTLLIEGAWMAGDVAPGLLRELFGFTHWSGHDARMWAELTAEARERAGAGLRRLPAVFGSDHDPSAVAIACAAVGRAGLAELVTIEVRDLSESDPARLGDPRPGLVVANPPYGERLSEAKALEPLYAQLGAVLRERFVGWKAAVFTANPDLAKRLALRAHHMYTLYNGALEAKVLDFDIAPESFMRERTVPPSPGARMFRNRLEKDLKHFGRWARRGGITCYRIYDADLPDYAVAVDVYEVDDGAPDVRGRWAHVAEYEAPPTIDPKKAAARLAEATAVIPVVLEVPQDRVIVKVRRRQRKSSQYERLGGAGAMMEVREGDARYLVDLVDYVDTGLFLDQRVTRRLISEFAAGVSFLNLFGYTGTASVAAGLGGATATTTVDMSKTYLDWARRNMVANRLTGPKHTYVQADALQWLKDPGRGLVGSSGGQEPHWVRARGGGQPRRYGLIFLDPPTFSTSKRMAGTLDVQRDHVLLIRSAAALLDSGGVLLFSANLRTFKLDAQALSDLKVRDITRSTLPKDFERNPKIHSIFEIRQVKQSS